MTHFLATKVWDNVFHFMICYLTDTFYVAQRIPNKFLMKYGYDLSNPVFLKLPSGSEWKIELRRWEDEAWLDKGWPKFSTFYSLDYCHSLVFGYEGKSKFCVHIFDRNFTEIAYPLTMPEMKETDEVDDSESESESDDDFSDDSVEILDNFLPHSRKSSSSGIKAETNINFHNVAPHLN